MELSTSGVVGKIQNFVDKSAKCIPNHQGFMIVCVKSKIHLLTRPIEFMCQKKELLLSSCSLFRFGILQRTAMRHHHDWQCHQMAMVGMVDATLPRISDHQQCFQQHFCNVSVTFWWFWQCFDSEFQPAISVSSTCQNFMNPRWANTKPKSWMHSWQSVHTVLSCILFQKPEVLSSGSQNLF